jgi:hypothetical protein
MPDLRCWVASALRRSHPARVAAAIGLWLPAAVTDRVRRVDPPARLRTGLDWAKQPDGLDRLRCARHRDGGGAVDV